MIPTNSHGAMMGRNTACALFAFVGALCAPLIATAQTTTVTYRGDTALVTTRLPQCTSNCPSLVHLALIVNGTRYVRDSVPKATDVLRILRQPGQAFTVTREYSTTSKVSVASISIAALPAPPVVVPPIVGAYVAPIAPRATVDVTYPAPPLHSVRLAAGGDLQAALNAAQPGDELVLANGATLVGNFVLPNKTGAGWIVIRAESLSSAGVRTDPTRATARVVTPNSEAAIRTAQGAHHWRLVGFEIAHQAGAQYNYGIVVLGRGDGGDSTLALLPHHITLDRMFIHGSTSDGTSRCVAFNGIALAVVDSYLSECHANANDAQGIAGWNGPGPFLIENNRIEGSGQAIMFGGADPAIPKLTPSDITVRRNYLFKPLDWHGKWQVKATIELKHAARMAITGNVLENHWMDAQNGSALLFMSASQNGKAPWNTVEDILFQDNIVVRSAAGPNIASKLTFAGITPAPSKRIAILNNVWTDVGIDPFRGDKGNLFQLLDDLQDLTIANNTFTLSGTAYRVINFGGAPEQRLVFRDNCFPFTTYGVGGTNVGMGVAALTPYAPGAVFTGNIIPKGTQGGVVYPGGNLFPDTPATTCNTNMSAVHTATQGVVR